MFALITGNDSFAAGMTLSPGIITLQTGFALSVRCPPSPTPEHGAQLGPFWVWGQWLCPSEDWAAPLLRQKSEKQLRKKRKRNGNWAGKKKKREKG